MNTLPEAEPRLGFLFRDSPARPVAAVWPGAPEPVADLGALLASLVARLADAGLEVVAVDQTEPGLRDRLGLYGAKVVVPGSLPMTFGHVNRRTRGCPGSCTSPPARPHRPAPAPPRPGAPPAPLP